MFQTEPILFLQSFSTDVLDTFFKLVTSLGYEWFLTAFLIAFMFGISYRKGYFLIQIALWNGIIIGCLKETFGLPRPANVDSRVQLLGKDYPNPTSLRAMGAKHFWGALPQQSIDHLRNTRFDDFGFPSGHTSGAVTVWGTLLLFFKNTWVRLICGTLILLIPLSRMYLGRHFLADVLGGYAAGILLLACMYLFVYKNGSIQNVIFREKNDVSFDSRKLLFILYSCFLPLLVLFIPNVEPQRIASLLGINIGYLFVWKKGIPDDNASVYKRILRILISFICYFAVRFVSSKIMDVLVSGDSVYYECIPILLTTCFVIWGSTELSVRLGLFKRQ